MALHILTQSVTVNIVNEHSTMCDSRTYLNCMNSALVDNGLHADS